MKILLLKPINDIYYVIQPNLGLGYLATIMLAGGHNVRILDSGKEKLKWNEFAKLVKEERYDIIGIQMFTHEVLSVKKHIEIIKQHSPDTTIICGGAHISGDPEGTMKMLEGLDFGFVGEAETAIKKFMELKKIEYGNHKLLMTIPNLVWRKGDKVVINPREFIKELDKIGFPAWHLMPLSDYPVSPHGTFCKRAPVGALIISRGCPFRCTFCAGKVVTGQTIRYRSVSNVLEEISLLYHRYGAREIHIEDDNFTLKRDYVIDFCNAIIRSGMDLAFALPNGVRLDSLDEEMVKLMEKAGFYSMAVGIESGSDRILALMKKNLSKKTIKEKIDLIKKYTRINLTGFFLMGYPGETEGEILETIDFAKSLKLDKASFMFLMPLPGSELWDLYKQGKRDIDWNNFFYYRIVEGMSDIAAEDLRRLHKKAVLEFYLRPKIIIGIISEIRTFTQIRILAGRLYNIFNI